MNKRKFSADEISLIHRTMMDGASKDDVALFVATCERTGLDPFARQIMPSSRNTQKDGKWVTLWTWLVTIDGLRKIAVDSGDYEGQEGPWWCGPDGVWKEIWTDPKNPCFAAKVLVHRKGFRNGLSGIAKYASYVQKKKDGNPNNVWSNLGDHMTAKCAEALALRRAYPNEMAGLYTTDEMAQAGFDVREEPKGEAHQPTPQPQHQAETSAWDNEALSEFASIEDRAYVAFKDAGMPDAYPDFIKKWKESKKTGSPKDTLPKFEEWVKKLEAAAAKKKADPGEVAA